MRRGSASSTATTRERRSTATLTSTPHVWPRSRVTRKMPSAVASDDRDRLRARASAASVDARSFDVSVQSLGAAVALAGHRRAAAARLAEATAASAAATIDEQHERQREDDDAEGADRCPGSASSCRHRRPARGCARARRSPSCRRARRVLTTEPALVRAPRPMFTGATSIVSLPMKAPSPIVGAVLPRRRRSSR